MIFKKRGNLQLVTVFTLLVVVVNRAEDFDVLNPCFEKCGLEQSDDLVRQHPCYDDFSSLPDSIRIPLECFAECTQSPFDCSNHGGDLRTRIKRFFMGAGASIASAINMDLYGSSVHALVMQDDSTENLMGFYRGQPYAKGGIGPLSSRDQGYTPSEEGSSDAEASTDSGEQQVRSVGTSEAWFWSACGAFQDFFSCHSLFLPHHYLPTGKARLGITDQSEQVEAVDDVSEVVVEATEEAADVEVEAPEKSGIFSWLWSSTGESSADDVITGADNLDVDNEVSGYFLPTFSVPSFSIPSFSLPSFTLDEVLETAQTFGVFAVKATAFASVGATFYVFWKKHYSKPGAEPSMKKRTERSLSRSGRRKTSKRKLSLRKRMRSKVIDVKIEDSVENDEQAPRIEPVQTSSDDSQVKETKSDPGNMQPVAEVTPAHSSVQVDAEELPVVTSIEEEPVVEGDKMSVCESEGPGEQIGDGMRDILQACTKVHDPYDIAKPQELHIGYAEIQQVPMPVDPCSGDIDPQLLKTKLEVMTSLHNTDTPAHDVTPHERPADVRGFYDNFRPDMSLDDFMSLLDKSVKGEGNGLEVDGVSHDSCATSMQCTAVGSSDVTSPSTQICATQTQQQHDFQTPQPEVEAPDNELIVTQMYANYVAKNPQKRWVKKLLQKRLTGPSPTPSAIPKPTPRFDRVCSIDSYKQKGNRLDKITEGTTVATLTAGDVMLARKMSIARHTVSDTSVTYIVR